MGLGQPVSGVDLQRIANENVSDKLVESTMKDPTFRDFVKICILMSMTGAVSKEDQQFGHAFIMHNPQKHGDVVQVDFDVKVTAKPFNKGVVV